MLTSNPGPSLALSLYCEVSTWPLASVLEAGRPLTSTSLTRATFDWSRDDPPTLAPASDWSIIDPLTYRKIENMHQWPQGAYICTYFRSQVFTIHYKAKCSAYIFSQMA